MENQNNNPNKIDNKDFNNLPKKTIIKIEAIVSKICVKPITNVFNLITFASKLIKNFNQNPNEKNYFFTRIHFNVWICSNTNYRC